MKAFILAGGLGTRLSEETAIRPKPMVEIGGKPILWHILKIYSHYGINDFIICCGYKGYLIKEYFANYFLHSGSGLQGRPSLGAWTTYGLGSECRDLPGYVVLNNDWVPNGGLENFGSSFLPASHQATMMRATSASAAAAPPCGPAT